ncbi:Ig-like domain-containing protein [Gilvibacter sp.]|uniref:Ig-like domain-containing protein n=1 Tax=Gilvibacter sp. TaxID=2729997 RepID=UPI003F49FA3C
MNMPAFFKAFLILICAGLLALSPASCAKKGSPEGGPRDTIPPVVVRTVPENYSVNFDAKEIRIYFDEYVRLNNASRQMIVSPPFDNPPDISPLGAAKFIKIKINDTLKPNTTYAINFGKSIADNNENNEYPYYRYVFSTGSYIDSLSVSGRVKDAFLREPEKELTVMLYQIDSTYTDSVVFLEKPYYIANVTDSTSGFSLENLKAGRYLLTAMKDSNFNYTFEPGQDKIGYLEEYIEVPTDTTYELTLFKEVLEYNLERPVQVSGGQVLFGYRGEADSLQISMVEPATGFETLQTKDRERDSLRLWIRPKIKADSMVFHAYNQTYLDTLVLRWRDFNMDTLNVRAEKSGRVDFDQTFALVSDTPIDSVLTERIKITNKDSMQIPFDYTIDSLYNRVEFPFDYGESQTYNIEMLPGALTDYFGNKNDTLSFRVGTQNYSDFGTLTVNVANAKSYPLIIDLVKSNGELDDSYYITEAKPVRFQYIAPGEYYIRVIYDLNGNGRWDPGNFLDKTQAEPVFYTEGAEEMNSNWVREVTFRLPE